MSSPAGARTARRRFRFLAIVLAALVAGAAPLAAQPIALVGATLIDGTGAPPLVDAAVVIDGDRILAVGPADATAIPADARHIDVRGKWLLPGLIDAHVHFFQSGGAYTRPDILNLRTIRPYDQEVAALRAAVPATLARTLASGITTVVDVGGPYWTFAVREIAARTPAAPRVAVTGPLLTTYLPPEIAVADPPMVRIAAPEQARAEVRRLVAQRPDLIKIWFVRAGVDISPQVAWVRAAIDETHAAGVRIAVHATELRVARAVVEAGADVLVHGVDEFVVDAPFVFQLQAQGVVYTPTLAVVEGYARALGLAFRPTAMESRAGDPAAIESLLQLAQLPARGLRATPVPPIDPESAANLRRLRDGGVIITAGSDAGNIGTLHGPGLHRELELMVQAGLTPMEVLVAATGNGAALLRNDQIGTVAAGKIADLLLLDADPLADIRNTTRIWRVVRAGVVYDPEELLANVPR
jgi:imidazolonepropionase-like amidohydrolase